MRSKNNNKYIFIILALLIAFALYLQFSIEKGTERLQELEIKKAEQYADKIARYLESETNGNLKEYLEYHNEKRELLNNILHAFLTDEFQYIFLLTRDESGHYRFLLDGSLSDPVDFNTIFFPQSNQFDQVYQSRKAQIIEQNEGVEEVWRSLLYPIVKDDKTQALLVMDLSQKYASYITDLNSPVSKTVRLMQFFLLASFLFLAYLTYSYYRFRKSVLFDPVTGCNTKVFMNELLARNSVDSYNIILIDIDEFKKINEKFGYENGDRLLKAFVETLYTSIPHGSRLIRLVGAEFALLIPKNVDLSVTIKSLFNTLQEKQYLVNNEPVKLTVSMSGIITPEGALSIENILRLLDEKMLEVKSRGKNAYAIIGEKHLDDLRYSNIDYIKKALDEERIVCLYQPIYRTQTKQIAKYEALVRIVDDENEGKLISPFHFLPIIKGTSQYIKMSKLVLQNVFETLRRYEEIEVSMNLDLTDLFNRDMMLLITNELYAHKEIAHRLTFEIVEDMEVKDFDKVSVIFKQLRSYGSKIALDDFGSGYANYTYLINLDWDIIKIDGSLIKELLINPDRAEPIVRSINELGVYFQCEVVAEFVSDQEIYESVKNLCIEFSQGYYLGEPKPITGYIEKPKQITSDRKI